MREVAEPDRVEINTELLYTQEERHVARTRYAEDHPNGPAWDEANRNERGRYLERAGREWLSRFRGNALDDPA